MALITADAFKTEIRKLADTAKLKADALDSAFLANADPRAIQGGAIDEEAEAWRELSRCLRMVVTTTHIGDFGA